MNNLFFNGDKMSEHKIKQFKYSGDVTFTIRIHFRQNACFQGELYWVERNQKNSFRSLLELIMLMQEAMEMTGKPEADYKFRTWLCDKQASGDISYF